MKKKEKIKFLEEEIKLLETENKHLEEQIKLLKQWNELLKESTVYPLKDPIVYPYPSYPWVGAPVTSSSTSKYWTKDHEYWTTKKGDA